MIIKHQSNYINRRKEKYPEIGDQLDLLYKGFVQMHNEGFSLPTEIIQWINQIQTIKETYPKPVDSTVKSDKE